MSKVKGSASERAPWALKTPPGDLPPVLEVLGLAEVEHNAKNNRMRAK
ncbi:MAG: DUF6855 family protein [Polyangiaceae bacterium]